MILSMPINKINAKNINLYKESAKKLLSFDQKQENFIVSWKFIFKYDIKAEIFKRL